MPSIRTLFPAALLLIAVTAAPLRSAEACSGGDCGGGHFLPEAATLPANLPAMVWIPRFGQGAGPYPSGVGLFLVTANGEQPVPVTAIQPDLNFNRLIVTPQSPLSPDSDYVIRGADYCTGTGMIDNTATHTTLHTTATAPPPSTLGDVAASAQLQGPLQVKTISGSCSSMIDAAQVTVDLTLSADAAPWDAALTYEILADNKPWSTSMSLDAEPPAGGSKHAVVFASCNSIDHGADKGLSEGTHSIVFRASLPGSAMTVETKPVSVTLTCQNAGSSSSSSGSGGGGGGGAQPPPMEVSGCSFGAGSSSGIGWAFAIAALAATALRRRRAMVL